MALKESLRYNYFSSKTKESMYRLFEWIKKNCAAWQSRLAGDLKKKAFVSEMLGISQEGNALHVALVKKEKGKIALSFCRSISLSQQENASSLLLPQQRIAAGIEVHEIVLRHLSLPL